MSVSNVDTGAVLGVGSLRANLKFYATADPNRMPIRSVKINWGDNTDFVDPGVQNYYKNHDGGIDVNKNQPDCSTNNSFAQTTNTCDPKPFAYSHVYSCNIGATNNTADKDYPNLGLVKGKPDCVYTPTVSVTDNWGATVLPVPISANVGSTVKVILAPAQ
jgi:signal peptidase I